MKITRSFIMDNRTVKGAWTRPQIEALGISWPPRKGWINRVVGKEMSLDEQRVFESKVTSTTRKRQVRQWASKDFEFETRKKAALDRHKADEQLDRESLIEANKFI